MIELDLFLGFPVDRNFQERLQEIKPELLSLFIGPDPAYLQELSSEEGYFLGKKIGKEIDLENLRLAEENIYSLLKRLLPDYPVKDVSLILFPVPHEQRV